VVAGEWEIGVGAAREEQAGVRGIHGDSSRVCAWEMTVIAGDEARMAA
jgi:hypothetical protein